MELTIVPLYLIEILHQTTTRRLLCRQAVGLYLIEILHQTTTADCPMKIFVSCILSKFYIKPQLRLPERVVDRVVSYRNSTSNHNGTSDRSCQLSVVSYRNSTSNHNWKSFIVCNLVLYLIEILHQTTTDDEIDQIWAELYLIEILHQTTTVNMLRIGSRQLYLIEILHQTTTPLWHLRRLRCCILSKFYIKPQPSGCSTRR